MLSYIKITRKISLLFSPDIQQYVKTHLIRRELHKNVVTSCRARTKRRQLTVLIFEGSIVIGRNFRDQMKSTSRYGSIDTSVVNYVNCPAMKNWRAN